MAKSASPNQLGFDFAEPAHPWLTPSMKPVAPEAPCAIRLPIPQPDRHGVIDFRGVLHSLRMSVPYTDGYDGHVALMRDLEAWHRYDFDSLEDVPEEVHVAVDGDVSAVAFPVLTGRGHWLCGGLLSCGGDAWEELPDVMVDVGGTTRQAALRGFARHHAGWFERHMDPWCHSGLSDATRTSAGRVTDMLRAFADAA